MDSLVQKLADLEDISVHPLVDLKLVVDYQILLESSLELLDDVVQLVV